MTMDNYHHYYTQKMQKIYPSFLLRVIQLFDEYEKIVLDYYSKHRIEIEIN